MSVLLLVVLGEVPSWPTHAGGVRGLCTVRLLQMLPEELRNSGMLIFVSHKEHR